jgi:CheY-like chemotaxis protein
MDSAQPGPILVVDDDRTMARLMKLTLARLGREIHSTDNGDDALGLVEKLRPALLILDLNMPRRGGIEVLRTLSRAPAGRRMAIIVVSAQAQPETADRVLEAGASAYFRKPVVLKDLAEKARALLQEVEGASPA